MKLTNDQVRHVAQLARLELSEGEVEQFSNQLSSILDHINTLNELDTDDVEPTSHALDLTNVFRADGAIDKFKPGLWTANAPEQESGHFRVPKIIEEQA